MAAANLAARAARGILRGLLVVHPPTQPGLRLGDGITCGDGELGKARRDHWLIGRAGGTGQGGDGESDPDGQGESFHDSQSRRSFGERLAVCHRTTPRSPRHYSRGPLDSSREGRADEGVMRRLRPRRQFTARAGRAHDKRRRHERSEAELWRRHGVVPLRKPNGRQLRVRRRLPLRSGVRLR
jgi:hypothetical protein